MRSATPAGCLQAHCGFVFPRNGGRPTAFRYFNLLAPVLGDESVFAEVESTDATIQPLMDSEPVLCRFIYTFNSAVFLCVYMVPRRVKPSPRFR